MNRQDLITEMRELREQVPGVTGALVAGFDGRLMAADLGLGNGPAVDPDFLAASAAASLGIARQVVSLTGQGRLGQAVTHASRGHLAVYAIGDAALLAVLGDNGLDADALHRKSQLALGRIHAILAR
jgi:uncharacterized protein